MESAGPVRDKGNATGAWKSAASGTGRGRNGGSKRQPVVGPAAILVLQAQAGNRAVSQILSRPPTSLQRLVKTKPSDLDSLADNLKRAVGATQGTKNPESRLFGDIRGLLTDYRRQAQTGTSTVSIQARQLEHIDDLCAQYVTTYGRGQKSRARVLVRLQKDINTERASLSKAEAMGIYQGSVENAGPAKAANAPGGSGGDGLGASKFGFKGLTSFGQIGATDHTRNIPDPAYRGIPRAERIKLAQKKYGLTDAEVSAITIYSAGDFSYINPVTANSSGWLADQQAKERKGKNPEAWASLDDKTVKEEGGLHAGMAVHGLQKMKPYKGNTYRGARYTPEDFHRQFASGKTTTFAALGSSSKDPDVALKFAYFLASGSVADPAKSVGVLTTVVDSGGRDVSGIALVQEEAEVLILPGTTFEVVSVDRIKDPDAKYAEIAAEAKKSQKPLPTEFYSVRIRRIPTPSNAKTPVTKAPDQASRSRPQTTPWKATSPGKAADPFALPSSPGTLGLDRNRPDRAVDLTKSDLDRALEKMERAQVESQDALALFAPDGPGQK